MQDQYKSYSINVSHYYYFCFAGPVQVVQQVPTEDDRGLPAEGPVQAPHCRGALEAPLPQEGQGQEESHAGTQERRPEDGTHQSEIL